MLPKEEAKISNMTEGWLFKFYGIINFGTNELVFLSQVRKHNQMRGMSPRQVSCFIDDLYIYIS